jgi:hypothetical protein
VTFPNWRPGSVADRNIGDFALPSLVAEGRGCHGFEYLFEKWKFIAIIITIIIIAIGMDAAVSGLCIILDWEIKVTYNNNIL